MENKFVKFILNLIVLAWFLFWWGVFFMVAMAIQSSMP